jgi:hypothetical protein
VTPGASFGVDASALSTGPRAPAWDDLQELAAAALLLDGCESGTGAIACPGTPPPEPGSIGGTAKRVQTLAGFEWRSELSP